MAFFLGTLKKNLLPKAYVIIRGRGRSDSPPLCATFVQELVQPCVYNCLPRDPVNPKIIGSFSMISVVIRVGGRLEIKFTRWVTGVRIPPSQPKIPTSYPDHRHYLRQSTLRSPLNTMEGRQPPSPDKWLKVRE